MSDRIVKEIVGPVSRKGVKQYRSKSAKGNTGLPGVHLFLWPVHQAVSLLPSGGGRSGGHLLLACARFVGSEEVGWMCILGAAPFAACGFFKYHGMTAEQVAWAWFKSEFLYPKKLVFKSENLYYDALKDAIAEGEKPPRKRKKPP